MRAAIKWSFFRNDRHSLKPKLDNQRGFFPVALVHEGEEQADLHGFDFYVTRNTPRSPSLKVQLHHAAVKLNRRVLVSCHRNI